MHSLLLLVQLTPGQGGVLEVVRTAGGLAVGVLILLAGFAIVSWAVIFDRFLLFRKANRQSDEFLEVFRKSSKFSQAKSACEELSDSPLAGLFLAGYAELAGQLDRGKSDNPSPRAVRLSALERSLMRATKVEQRRLRRFMMFLATTGAVTPFIGLFGTVWGIMIAFINIGTYQSADLAVVAPGIATALITTVGGLAAAIPAVVAYNHLLGKTRELTGRMEDFSLEFLNVVDRNFETER